MVRSFIMRPRVIQGMLRLWTGDVDGALETLGAIQTEVIERGQEGFTPMLSLYLVWAAVWRGDLGNALRWSDEARAAAELLEDPTGSALALSSSALVHAHDGRTDLARIEAGEALALFQTLQWQSGAIWPLWAVGLAELSDGNPEGVHSALGPLAEAVAAMGPGDPVLTSFLPEEVEALVALGELKQADAFLTSFERVARELDRAWALAVAARCRGVLAAARGEPEAAFDAFERALSEHERINMPIERARTLLLAGQTYRRYKQRAQARKLIGRGPRRVRAARSAELGRAGTRRTGSGGRAVSRARRPHRIRAPACGAGRGRPVEPGDRGPRVRLGQDGRSQPHARV
jgi:tetratricopeptide (TPR) repeat protein